LFICILRLFICILRMCMRVVIWCIKFLVYWTIILNFTFFTVLFSIFYVNWFNTFWLSWIFYFWLFLLQICVFELSLNFLLYYSLLTLNLLCHVTHVTLCTVLLILSNAIVVGKLWSVRVKIGWRILFRWFNQLIYVHYFILKLIRRLTCLF